VRNGRTKRKGREEEGENKISPPSPGKIRTEAVKNLTEEVEKKNRRKRKLLLGERRELLITWSNNKVKVKVKVNHRIL
jgi:hypothetical protein